MHIKAAGFAEIKTPKKTAGTSVRIDARTQKSERKLVFVKLIDSSRGYKSM